MRTPEADCPPPITAGLFVADDPRSEHFALRAGRHGKSGRFVFPCPDDDDHEAIALSSTGWLWSFTVQRFRPKSPPYSGPDAFEPYAVGYVELPGQLIVESRLTGIPFDALQIGMALRLTAIKVPRADGTAASSFAYTSIASPETVA